MLRTLLGLFLKKVIHYTTEKVIHYITLLYCYGVQLTGTAMVAHINTNSIDTTTGIGSIPAYEPFRGDCHVYFIYSL